MRCLCRHPERLRWRVGQSTDVVAGDVLDRDSLTAALHDVDTALLPRSFARRGVRSFEEEDRQGAANFATAARVAGVRRIIYLGGLGDAEHGLSPHLRSRQETGEILRSTGVQVIEFRASILIGSGSLSFELIRTLVERLPVMICPKWVATPTQPIAIEDVLDYLLAAVDLPFTESRIFEIGGPDQVSYGEIMREYARQRGLRRWMISVPLLTPRLSSLWLGLVTPVYARVGRKLVEGLRNPTVVRDPAASDAFSLRPRSLEASIQRASANEDRDFAETRWSDALSAAGPHTRLGRHTVRNTDCRFADGGSRRAAGASLRADPANRRQHRLVLRQSALEGARVAGPVGRRRGPPPRTPRPGQSRDRRSARLLARGSHRTGTPPAARGRNAAAGTRVGWSSRSPQSPNGSAIRQTAIFDPLGLGGLCYWYALYPIHHLVFTGMLTRLAAAAAKKSAAGS